MFNRLVCQKLDFLEAKSEPIPTGQSKLGYAGTIVKNEIESIISDQEIEAYLVKKLQNQKSKRLEKILESALQRFLNPEKATAYAALLFEIQERKTDNIWQQPKFEKIIAKGLGSETISLISMLCCINQFGLAGGYTLVPDLFAYRQNTKLEPVPLIIDELVSVVDFFGYYGIKANLTLYVSDTDYTEIGQFGKVTPGNLVNLQEYLQNLKAYTNNRNPQVQVIPISALTNNNSLYLEVKTRVLKNVTRFKDPDFEREWYPKFEEAFERVSESQIKRKLFPANEIRGKSLEITRMIWAVNAAQGTVLGTLGENTILVSTERRERDQNYIIDRSAKEKLPPVIYILRAAEMWNRKLTGKMD